MVTVNCAPTIAGAFVEYIQLVGEFKSADDCNVNPSAFVRQERTSSLPFTREFNLTGITIRKMVPPLFVPPEYVVPYKLPSLA